MGKLTGNGKHTVKVGNHPHTNISKQVIMRRGEYKCRTLEMHWKLRDEKFGTILYMYRLLYKNLMGTTNKKFAMDTHTKNKKQSKHNTKDRHQITRENNKRGREEKDLQKQTQNN